ncbi:MAG: hypothetical protein II194_08070 [Bacteroidales bacterium]|nr:hypothetical protein [Bacteroidales bacterium]
MDKKKIYMEYESPRTSLLILNVEGLLCTSIPGGNDDMDVELLDDIFE